MNTAIFYTCGMKSVSFDVVIQLKKAVQAEFGEGTKVHFHDYCSSQAFSLEAPNAALQAFVEQWFAAQGFRAVFNDAGTEFVLE